MGKKNSDNIATSWTVIDEGLQIHYLKEGKYLDSFIVEYDKWLDMFNTRTNVPQMFRKIKTLEKDFQPDYEAVQRFEEQIKK